MTLSALDAQSLLAIGGSALAFIGTLASAIRWAVGTVLDLKVTPAITKLTTEAAALAVAFTEEKAEKIRRHEETTLILSDLTRLVGDLNTRVRVLEDRAKVGAPRRKAS